MEAQLACWDQLQSGSEEVGSWVNTMVTKLEDSLTNFDDIVGVETRLQKFKVGYMLGFVYSLVHKKAKLGTFKIDSVMWQTNAVMMESEDLY